MNGSKEQNQIGHNRLAVRALHFGEARKQGTYSYMIAQWTGPGGDLAAEGASSGGPVADSATARFGDGDEKFTQRGLARNLAAH